jgi:uncharacterized membrane protein YgdD (TMEM256/DUF423 family)
MIRLALIFAGLSGATAVALGAASAHLDPAGFDARAQGWIDTALTYQRFHAVALLAAAALASVRPGPAANAAIIGFAAGTVLFCGSLLVMAFTGFAGLGLITPFGGVAFIVGWLCLVWHGVRSR